MLLDEITDYYWAYSDGKIYTMSHSESAGSGPIAKLLDGCPDKSQINANGRLMAAAPDMLRELRDLRVKLWDFLATFITRQEYPSGLLDCVDELDKFIKCIDPEDEV